METLKSKLYSSYRFFIQTYWKMLGEQSIRVFDHVLFMTHDSVFPSYWNLPLPQKDTRSKIVKYCDYVQFHSVVDYLSCFKEEIVVVDVGAHHGAYAILLGKIVQPFGGKVIAFEPDPDSFGILRSNVRMNNLAETIIVENRAVMDQAGFVRFIPGSSQSRISHGDDGISVESTTLKESLSEHAISRVDFLMIDVEGAELNVLRGFPWEIMRPGRIFCELHPYAWKEFGYTGEDFMDFLKQHGYRCFDMYFREYTEFTSDDYIGPTVFVPRDEPLP